MDNIDSFEVIGSEPFPNWPSLEDFKKGQDIALKRNKKDLKRQLLDLGYSHDVLEPMSIVMARTNYVYRFLADNTNLDNKIKTKLIWATNLHKQIPGEVSAHFLVDGAKVESFDELKKAAHDKSKVVSLSEVDIGMNLVQLYEKMKSDNRFLKRGKDMYPKDKQMRKERWTEDVQIQSILCEKTIAEEIGHALFLASVTGYPSKFKEWITEHEGYKPLVPSDDNLIPIYSPEEIQDKERNYYKKRIEVKGQIFVNQFMQKYHPEIIELV